MTCAVASARSGAERKPGQGEGIQECLHQRVGFRMGFLSSSRGLPSRSSSRAPRVPNRRSARAAASNRCTRPACLRTPRLHCSTRAGRGSRTRNANDLGGLLFRNVAGRRLPRAPRVERRDVGPADGADEAVGAAVDRRPRPDDPVRRLRLPDHRDGTKLAYSVHPPSDVTNVGGVDLPHNPAGDSVPSPTLIEYSGYGYAKPDGPQSGIATLANIMGYTVVDVNMRGTGCSGRAFNFFEPCRTSTATTSSRRSRVSPGSPTARSGCWASPTVASASCSPPRPSRRAWPRSRRSR